MQREQSFVNWILWEREMTEHRTVGKAEITQPGALKC
jgi:hypothetical protein